MVRWGVRALKAGIVLAAGAGFFVAGVTATLLKTGLLADPVPGCVMGHVPHPTPFTLFTQCVNPPGYGPWAALFGAASAVLGLLLAVGVLRQVSRLRSRST